MQLHGLWGKVPENQTYIVHGQCFNYYWRIIVSGQNVGFRVKCYWRIIVSGQNVGFRAVKCYWRIIVSGQNVGFRAVKCYWRIIVSGQNGGFRVKCLLQRQVFQVGLSFLMQLSP